MRELEQEQVDVAEIESCDIDFLNELKASIAEQRSFPLLL
jgi:kinetochore protein Spc7/SPC105